MKSKIQRAPDAEDGEIISSPELDAADLEIKIHEDATTSEDSDIEETTPSKPSVSVKASANKQPDVIIVDTPTPTKEKEKYGKSSTHSDFRQKEQPISRRIHSLVHQDDDVEIDHLEITAPQQQDASKKNMKSVKPNKESPNKGKYASSFNKDRRTHVSPKDEFGRKRPYDVFDERRPRSDPDIKHHRMKQRDDNVGDLRSRLIKKEAQKSRDRNERDDRGTTHDDRGTTRDDYASGSVKDDRGSRDNRSGRDVLPKSYEKDRKRDAEARDKYSTSLSEYEKYREAAKAAKKKKNKRKGSPYYESKEEKRDKKEKYMELQKSPVAKKEGKQSYDDITSSSSASSEPSPAPLAKSPESSASEAESEEEEGSVSPDPKSKSPSASPTPSASPESRSPSRSPTPERSPTPVKKRTYFPAIEGCRNVKEFVWLNRIEEGTYGVVYRAKDRNTEEIVALKRLKMEKEREGFPITSLREINTLLKAQHPNVVSVREIVVGDNMDKIYIVMDYVEHDLKSLMESMTQPFLVGEVKTLMLHLLRGIRHLHDNWILHRDIKASNLLLSHKGILKIGDFGLAREYGSPLKKYTSIVVTLWYRAPELLLRSKHYSTPIDIWSCGCVLAELLTLKPLFPGKAENDQISRIFKELGTPNDNIWPGPPAYSELPQVKVMNIAVHPYNVLRNRFGATLTDVGFDLLNRLLTYDPAQRITAHGALKHDFFKEAPSPVDPSMFPTWPAKSEGGHKQVKKNASPKPPSGGKNFDQLNDDLGFHMAATTTGSSAKGLGFNLRF